MAKQKKRIILTGAQGTGKTTLMNALAADGTRTISHIRKTAEELGIDISNPTEVGQKEFFKTLKKELSSKKNYISDRGLTCVAAYTFSEAIMEKISKKVADKQYMDVLKFHTENPDILLVYVPIEFGIEDDGERSVDASYQHQIDFLIKNILETAKINYITVTGTVEERVSQIEAALKSKEEQ
jgi:predicted ATPase